MTEILTESFCERCGTRYTFQTAAPQKGRMGRLRVLSKGLRNYVLSDETTFTDALTDARNDEEREVSSQQLEAFHKTFNFCMSCRQYTCPNCWNHTENRCLSCAPELDREILPAPFPDLDARAGLGADAPSRNEERAALAALSWPEGALTTEEPERDADGEWEPDRGRRDRRIGRFGGHGRTGQRCEREQQCFGECFRFVEQQWGGSRGGCVPVAGHGEPGGDRRRGRDAVPGGRRGHRAGRRSGCGAADAHRPFEQRAADGVEQVPAAEVELIDLAQRRVLLLL